MTIDATTGLEMQVKRPGEYYPFTFDFINLNSAETIASLSNITQLKRGSVAGSVDLVIDGLAHDSNQQAQAWINGGTNGEYYCITCTVQTSTGATRTCSGVLWIKEAC